MKKSSVTSQIILLTACLLLSGTVNSFAQEGLSFSINWDFFPYQNFDVPPAGLDDAEIKINRAEAQITYPLVFSEGKTVLVNQLSYQHFEANYRNWPGGQEVPEVGILYAAQYTLMLQQELSEKWAMWSMLTPGMASDLHGKISKDDFNLQAVLIFIKKVSPKFSYGVGAAYTTAFGMDTPLPVLAFDWNNGSNLMLSAIIPTNIDLWYQAAKRVRLGLNIKVEGNEYHGDPKVHVGAIDPRLRYSVVKLGSTIKYNMTKKMSLNIQGGFIALHRFEFYDKDTEVASYDMKPSYFIRAGIEYGG